MSHPFQPIVKGAPVPCKTDYLKDDDKYIITYDVVERVKMTGEKDTDFVINKEVVEISRVNRQDYLDSHSDEVGIMNIIKKVALSGDTSLYNQTGRVGYPGSEIDSLGRPVEDIVDITNYQVDRVDALESYKAGAAAYADLPDELKQGLSMEGVAKMSDDEITAYVKGVVEAYKAANAPKPAEGGEK